tara:strand:+ start:1465 stop:1770 length:306 start_codon:yes stop_codon:yes gene_type:complete
MKVLEYIIAMFIGLFYVFMFILYHALRLGRNVAHFFFKVIAVAFFVGSYFAFDGSLLSYGLESYTGYFFLFASFIFSLMPWVYDEKILAKLIPEGETLYLG